MWTSFFRWLVSTAAGAIVGDVASERFKLGVKSLTQGGLRKEDMSIIDFVGGGGSTSYGGSSVVGWTPKKKRRRRARLTMSEIQELIQIKNILGKTAAANALPWYMGRGR